MTNLTIHQLRFTVEVTRTIKLGQFKGSALRGAWVGHLRDAYCQQRGQADALHESVCPVCYLLSRDSYAKGHVRRPYTLQVSPSEQETFEPGERFSFGMSLFGPTMRFLPYVVLGWNQVGQGDGLGERIHATAGRQPSQRGQFRLCQVEAVHPLRGECQVVVSADGGMTANRPTLCIDYADVMTEVKRLTDLLARNEGRLCVNFCTPTRLISDKKLVKDDILPHLIRRLYERVEALREQYADEARQPREIKQQLLEYVVATRETHNYTVWQELRGYSSRVKRGQPLSGLMGQVVYQARPEIWACLLEYLVWGTVVQVGKNTVKGGGMFSLLVESGK